MRCQSFMQPSSAEYWHIGAMTIRFASSRPPIRIGLNKADFDIAASLRVRMFIQGAPLFKRQSTLVRAIIRTHSSASYSMILVHNCSDLNRLRQVDNARLDPSTSRRRISFHEDGIGRDRPPREYHDY